MLKVAIVQESSVLLDRQKTIKKAVSMLEQAVAAGAELVIFPEAFIPGYPAWIWRLRPGGDWGLSEALHARLLDNAVNLDANGLAPLCDAAKKHEITIGCGLNEKKSQLSQATLYNTVVIIGSEGNILNRVTTGTVYLSGMLTQRPFKYTVPGESP